MTKAAMRRMSLWSGLKNVIKGQGAKGVRQITFGLTGVTWCCIQHP